MGEVRLTPDLDTLLACHPGWSSGEPLPKALARKIYEYIHGTDGNPNPIETWEEFEYVIDTILVELFPADTWEGLDIFWDPWNPQPEGYGDMADRWGQPWAMLKWMSDLFGHFIGEELSRDNWSIDKPYWREHCRVILKDLFLAAFNPNSQLNDYNPDRHINRRVDKSQLTRYTTELSLQPCGVFRIESFGAVKDNSGTVAAGREIHTMMELYRPFRVTTQAQFMKDVEDHNDIAEPSKNLRTAWDSMVASYPEPVIRGAGNDADFRYLQDSHYDGYIMPASWELEALTGSETLVSQFDGRLKPGFAKSDNDDLYSWGSTGTLWEKWKNGNVDTTHVTAGIVKSNYDFNPANDDQVSEYWRLCNRPSTGRLTYRAGSASNPRPGMLTPDGALSDTGRGIGYSADNMGSTDGYRASLQFWFKPNFDTPTTSRIRNIVDLTKMHPYNKRHRKWHG
ncbi:hypothetical protein ACFL54_00025 [Planctomycetota bacterium]